MPRSLKLTWQTGREGRAGRWRKKYKGKTYYFNGGNGKSDRTAYDVALKAWELEKLKIDCAAPRPNQKEYEAEIGVWEQVQTWSKRHGELGMAQLAHEKHQKLMELLQAPILQRLTREDRFRSLFEPITIDLPDDLFKGAGQLTVDDFKCRVSEPLSRERREQIALELDGSSLRIQREIWQDRLASQQRRVAVRSDSVEEHIQEFLRDKENKASHKDLSVGRCYALRLHLSHFQDWIGKDASLSDIDGHLLREYKSKLLDLVRKDESQAQASKRRNEKHSWTSTTAGHYLTTVKSFVRWLWEIEAIPNLPRVLAPRSTALQIAPKKTSPVKFEDEEVNVLLRKATGRTKLYLLLMLNCGMTQKDVADLRKSEVDLDAGRIVRKRSKTDKHESVPTVNYVLWPETVKLLREFMDGGTDDRALLNENGTHLWEERIDPNGKYWKSDNIKNAFDRLKKKVNISKPLKSLKKTSSSKLRDNERFNGVEDLFLGHAPQKMSDKHYAVIPQKLLDSAIRWLGTEYGLCIDHSKAVVPSGSE